jgi:hypothetical protein
MTKKLETTNEMNVDDAVIASAPLYRYLHCLIIHRPQKAFVVFTGSQVFRQKYFFFMGCTVPCYKNPSTMWSFPLVFYCLKNCAKGSRYGDCFISCFVLQHYIHSLFQFSLYSFAWNILSPSVLLKGAGTYFVDFLRNRMCTVKR